MLNRMQKYLPGDLCILISKISTTYDWCQMIYMLNKEYHTLWVPSVIDGCMVYRERATLVFNNYRLNLVRPGNERIHIMTIPGQPSGFYTPSRWAWSSPELTRNWHFTQRQ